MSDITSIAPYEPVTIQDTTDENRTDLVALLQRQENEIALQNQVIRQFLEHWDSISRMDSWFSNNGSLTFLGKDGNMQNRRVVIRANCTMVNQIEQGDTWVDAT